MRQMLIGWGASNNLLLILTTLVTLSCNAFVTTAKLEGLSFVAIYSVQIAK